MSTCLHMYIWLSYMVSLKYKNYFLPVPHERFPRLPGVLKFYVLLLTCNLTTPPPTPPLPFRKNWIYIKKKWPLRRSVPGLYIANYVINVSLMDICGRIILRLICFSKSISMHCSSDSNPPSKQYRGPGWSKRESRNTSQ